jgi:heterodisulfide reductase subunit D
MEKGIVLINKEKKNKPVYVWLGCTTRYNFKDTIKSIKSIFNKLNVDYEILDEDTNKYLCCASTLWGIGLNEYAESNRAKVEKILKEGMESGSHLISPCPGCARIFKKKYNFDPKPRHITEFLFDYLDKMKFINERPVQVSYHDSCHLARGLGVIEEPRVILHRIPNLTLKELSSCGEKALCCGSGGGLRAYNKDLADSMSSLIVEETISLGSSAIITACPFCERSFNDGRNLLGKNIEVKNFLGIVDEYLRRTS